MKAEKFELFEEMYAMFMEFIYKVCEIFGLEISNPYEDA